MRDSTTGFEADVRISLRPVLVAIAMVGILMLLFNNALRGLDERVEFLLFAFIVEVVVWIGWNLDRWKPRAGQWFIITSLCVMIWAGVSRTAVDELLVLLVFPVALAAASINLTAAAGVALVATVLTFSAGVSGITLALVLSQVWGVLAIMFAVYHPVFQVAQWAWEYFQRAQGLLEEARDRRAELERVLEDLANANVQLKRMNALAHGLRQAAEDARTAKEQFVANVSHELRTPLNMITGFSEMILQAPDMYGSRIPPTLLADLAVVHRNAEHLADLIDDVLDLSQIEVKQMALTKEHVSFADILETATTAVRPLFDSKGLYLRVDAPDELPTIFCDRTRIREVLLNLLSNAGRFTERGGVQIRVRPDGGDLVVTVADTGPGIAAADLGKLFQPFQQIDGSIRRRYGGTGLGLSISKGFIELHGGEIGVASEPGVGTTFTFRLPLTLTAPIASDFSRWLKPDWEFFERTRPPLPAEKVQPRFVVLEPGDALQHLLSRYMDEAEIVPVRDLDAALVELVRVPAQALLVNDVAVNRALERLRSVEVPNGTPVIICSIPDVREASADLDIDYRLVKPISRETLLDALDRLGIATGTVLIVDDEPDALQLFGRMLASSERAYRVLLARDGQEALEILHDAQQSLPDAILLDLVMPNLDGFQVLEIRDRDPVLRTVPVIVISARDPTGQPIVSSALAVMGGPGLSAQQLLTTIEFVSRTFRNS